MNKMHCLEQQQLNDLVFVQYNVQLKCNQLLNKTPDANPIVLEDIDPFLKWIMETKLATFEDDDLEWMDLEPHAALEVLGTNTNVLRGSRPKNEAMMIKIRILV